MMKVKNKALLFLSIAILGFIFCAFFSHSNYQKTNPQKALSYLQGKFHKNENKLNAYLNLMSQKKIANIPDLLNFCTAYNINEEEYVFYIYQDSILKAWSTNSINFPTSFTKKPNSNNLMICEHESIYFVQKQIDSLSIIGGYIIKKRGNPDYDFFSSDFFYNNKVSQYVDISLEEGPYNIFNKYGAIVFSIVFPDEINISDNIAIMELLLWMISLLFFYLGMYWLLLQVSFFNKRKNIIWGILTLLIAISTNIFSTFEIPSSLYTSNIFSSYYYASYFKSLGELFIKSCTLIFLTILIKSCISIDVNRLKNKLLKMLLGYLFILSAIAFCVIIFIFQYSIANDSIITISPLLLYNYNLLSAIILFSICSLFWALLIGFQKLFEESLQIFGSTKTFVRAVIISSGLTIIIGIFLFLKFYDFEHVYFIYLLVFVLFVSIVILRLIYPQKITVFITHIVACGLFGFLVFFITENANSRKKERHKEDFAEMIQMTENPLVIYDMSNIGAMIQSDQQIMNYLIRPGVCKDSIVDYINSQYLITYVGTYNENINVSLCSSSNDSMSIVNLKHKFQIANKFSEDGYVGFLRMERGRAYYMIKNLIPFTLDNKMDTAFIFIELESSFKFSKPFFNIKPHRIEKEIAQFSYAEYENDVLKTYNENTTPYKLSFKKYNLDTVYNGLNFVSDGYIHTVYKSSSNKTLLVSTIKTRVTKQLSSVSFIFLILIFYSFIPHTILYFFGKKRLHISFRMRIQRMVIFLLLGSSIIGGFLFVQYTISANKIELINNSMSRINFFNNFILSLQNDTSLILDKNMHDVDLSDLSQILNDYIPNVNIYNLEGEQIIIKQDKSFCNKNEKARINPYALKAISYESKTTYVEEKVLWDTKYVVLYKPMQNQNGDILGYLSYSSLAKEARIDHQLTGFFSTFLSLYGLFMLIAVMIGAFVTRYISSSLEKISALLAKINLQSVNQKIEWKYEDEIGQLIQQYNRLIDELEMSAELLSRSERESAWKTMAQQIAHEIKNPLTPMKLRTQQIQKEITDGKVDTKKLDQYIIMLLEQIDILNEIASSLSIFDRMHHADGEKENLIYIIDNLLILHANQKNYEIIFKNLTETNNVGVFINKTQLIRAFNNLIKNAIQATKEDENQKIIIELCDYGEQMWQIKVQDFGTGMDESTRKHAFTAHFSTKSSGMGLGLLMVKNIITDWNGSINLESTPNEGSIFTILLPKYTKET